MFLSGFADEAGADLATQIRAHKELGYSHVELRTVDKVQFTQASERKFEEIWEALQRAGLGISCYGSAIANWSRPVQGDLKIDTDDLRRSAPRMRKTGTQFIRIMSWKQADASEDEWKRLAIERMKVLAGIAEDEGITLVHENCDGWAGAAPENTLTLLEKVNSPALKLVFDTGNPLFHGQDAWEYYNLVKEHVVYVHVKDGKEVNGKLAACYAGEGQARVEDICTDLFRSGYDGGFSIEPHIAGAIHEGTIAGEEQSAYDIYIRYGRGFRALVERCRQKAR